MAFYGCSGLTGITIPNGVTSIEDFAFYDCNGLTSITIPSGVTSIETYIFSNCSGLTSVTIPGNVTSIENGAFNGCYGLTSVTFEAGSNISEGNFSISAFAPGSGYGVRAAYLEASPHDGIYTQSAGDTWIKQP
jgi:hypothetical protein